jgi:hypothetical protein
MTPRSGEMRDTSERRTETGRAVSHTREIGEMRDVQEMRDASETQMRPGPSVSHAREMRDGVLGLAWREMGIGRGGTR